MSKGSQKLSHDFLNLDIKLWRQSVIFITFKSHIIFLVIRENHANSGKRTKSVNKSKNSLGTEKTRKIPSGIKKLKWSWRGKNENRPILIDFDIKVES